MGVYKNNFFSMVMSPSHNKKHLNDENSTNSKEVSNNSLKKDLQKAEPVIFSNLKGKNTSRNRKRNSEPNIHTSLEQFLKTSQVTLMPDDPTSVSSVRKIYMPDELFEFIAERTNRTYAKEHKGKPEPKSLKWKDVTAQDIKTMLGVVINMSIVQKPTIHSYWHLGDAYETPAFGRIISRDRFMQIWRNWTCYDENEVEDQTDLLKEVQPIIKYFTNRFQAAYKPKRDLSLHEKMVRWKDHGHSFKLYNPLKSNNYEMLMRISCEAEIGVVCNLKIYSLKGVSLQTTIMELIEPYKGLEHHIYLENYYTSSDTCKLLVEEGFICCGIVRRNYNVKRKKPRYWRHKDIRIQVWSWSKTLIFIPLIHSDEIVKSSTIDKNTMQKIEKSEFLNEYNKFIKRVDRMNQYLSSGSMMHPTHSYSMTIMLYLFSVADYNAFRLYKALNPKSKLTYKKYREIAATDWTGYSTSALEYVEPTSTVDSSGAKKLILNFSLNITKHKMVKIDTGGKKEYAQRQCKVCSSEKIRGLTYYMCKECKVPLHNYPCYMKYHALPDN